MEKLISEVQIYAASRGLTPGTVLQAAANLSGQTWGKWVSGDASCTVRTMEKIRAYMAENPPSADHQKGAA